MLEINIFISYRSSDVAFRDKVLECLQPIKLSYKQEYTINIEFWYDEEDMVAGDRIADVLSENLQKSQIVICIFTPKYFQSEWCTLELKKSFELATPPSKKRLVPIVYEDVYWQTDWLKGLKVIPGDKSVIQAENQAEMLSNIAREIDKNIRIFAHPKLLDYRAKKKRIVMELRQPKPNLKESVMKFMTLVEEHSPDNELEATQIHDTYYIYEAKEDQVKLDELAKTRCDIIAKIYEIFNKIEKKYATG